MREIEISVIAPCLNEELNVPVLVDRTMSVFDRMSVGAELVIVDDGSTDATWQRVQEAMAKEPRVQGKRHAINRGIVGGWLSGMAAARGRLICLIDSDLQNRPEDIPRLYEAYEREHPDIVQAVRNPKQTKQRLVFSRALNHILNVTFGMHLRDNKSGFVLCPREILEDVLADADGYRYYQSFIGVAAGVRGYRFAEVDTDFEERAAGESFLSNYPIKVSLRICRELMRYRAQTWQSPPARKTPPVRKPAP
jgi:phenylacetate-CoA ligase